MKNLSQLTSDRIELERAVQHLINNSKAGVETVLKGFDIHGDLIPKTVVDAYRNYGTNFSSKWFEFLEKESLENPELLNFATGDEVMDRRPLAPITPDRITGEPMPAAPINPGPAVGGRKFTFETLDQILGGLSSVLNQVNIATGNSEDRITASTDDIRRNGNSNLLLPSTSSKFNLGKTLLIAVAVIAALVVTIVAIKKLS